MRNFLIILFFIAGQAYGQKMFYALNHSSAPVTLRLLDSFPSQAAYSLRRLSTAYTGAAIRVTRTSDTSQMDIGFVGSDLDTALLKSFVGSGSSYVSIWYDQSGNGANISPSALANAPLIVSSGVIQRDKGKPTINFVTKDMYLNVMNTLPTTSIISFFVVANILKDSTTYHRLLTAQGDNYFFIGANASEQVTTFYGNGSSWGTTSTQSTTTWLNTTRLLTDINNGNDNQYINNSLISSRSNAMASLRIVLSIGGKYGSFTNQPWLGTCSEIVVYTTDKTSDKTAIDTNINNYYSIY